MEMARRWFSKFRSKDKHKYSKKETTNGKEGSKAPTNEEAPSNATKQKVAAAKQYIEKHYKEQMKNLQERKERIGLYGGKEEKTLSFVTKDLLEWGNKEWSRDWNLNPRSYI